MSRDKYLSIRSAAQIFVDTHLQSIVVSMAISTYHMSKGLLSVRKFATTYVHENSRVDHCVDPYCRGALVLVGSITEPVRCAGAGFTNISSSAVDFE